MTEPGVAELLGEDPSELLARAVGSGELSERLVESSYIHPYGFAVVRLGPLDTGWGLRLHIWPEGHAEPAPARDWAVHDHAWDLRSHVLAGSIEHRTYRLRPDRSGGHRLYRVERASYGPGSSDLRALGEPLACGGVSSAEVAAGSGYRVPPGELHRSHPATTGLTATLVATEPARGRRSRVVGPVDGPPRVRFERRPLDRGRFEPLLVELLER
jgi:hypothetical protein